jgi:hypothetical protein
VGPEHGVPWDGSKKLYGSMPCLHIKLLVRQVAIMIRVMGRGCKHTHAARVKAFMTVVLKKPQLWLHARLRTWCIAYTNEPGGHPGVSASG